MRRALRLACGPLLATIVAASCIQQPLAVPDDRSRSDLRLAARQDITWALDFEPSGIDPHVNQAVNAARIISQIFDTLVYGAPGGGFVPGLAASWTVSADGRTYTLKLRRGVKFHDGTPFDAHAVVFSFDRIRDPQIKSQLAVALLGPVDRYSALDDSTVEIVFKTPYPAFLDALSQVWLAPVSPTAVKKYGAEFGRRLVGTGPFVLKEWVAKDHLRLERNPDYAWGPSLFKHSGAAHLHSITYRFAPDWSTRRIALETGEIDIATDALTLDAASLRANAALRVFTTTLAGTPQSYFLNTRKPPLDDRRVRQALIFAVDKETIVKTMQAGAFRPAYGPLSRATPGYDASFESGGRFGYDRRTAETLLDEAGWNAGPDGIRSRDGRPLRLTWLSQSINRDPLQGELLQGLLKDVGIDLQVVTVPTFPNLIAAIAADNYHLVPSWWLGGDPSVLTQTYHSRNIGANNWSKAAIPTLDRTLDAADAEPDAARREALYRQAQQVIMSEALAVPVWDTAPITVARASLDRLTFDRRGVYLWLYDAYVEG